MQIEEILAEGLKREYKIIIPASDVDQRINTRLKKLSEQVKIPGFRPGKVPANLLKKRFGESVMGEVLEQSVNETSQEVLNEKNVRPAMQPKVEVKSFEEGKDLEYTISLEIFPTVEPMDFSKLEVERVKITVPDEDVEQALEQLASGHKKTKPLSKARAAKSGDVVVIDFKGSVDGVTLPGMEGADHHLELGSGSFIPGFEEQLIGVKKGEDKTVEITFPENYPNEQLAGKATVFEVHVKDILETEASKVDEELAKAHGAENLEDLREKVRGRLQGEYEQVTRSQVKRQLLDQLAEQHSFEVPQVMTDHEFDLIWQQVSADKEKGQLDPEDEGKDEETLKSEYRTIAERRVRLGLLLSEVGRINALEVGQEELQQALLAEVRRYPGQEQQVYEHYTKNPEALVQLRAPIIEEKAIDFILNLAKVKERALSPDDFRKELEAKVTGGQSAESQAKSQKKSGATKSTKSSAKAKPETKTDEKSANAKNPETKKSAEKKSAEKKKTPAKKSPAKKEPAKS